MSFHITLVGGNVQIQAPSTAPVFEVKPDGDGRFYGDELVLRGTTFSDPTGTVRTLTLPESSGTLGYADNVWVAKEQQASGVQGGTFTSGAWQTRTLNVFQGVGSDVTLLANQLTFQPGTYHVHVSAPAYKVDGHQCRLFNLTAGASSAFGSSQFSVVAVIDQDPSTTVSDIDVVFTVAVPSVYEVQHWCNTTRLTDGFGRAAIIPLSSEVYTQVFITKIS